MKLFFTRHTVRVISQNRFIFVSISGMYSLWLCMNMLLLLLILLFYLKLDLLVIDLLDWKVPHLYIILFNSDIY